MAAEQIRIMCPSLSCRRVLAVPSSSRGKNVRCKGCGATIRVPEKQAAQSVRDPATAASAAGGAATAGAKTPPAQAA